MATVEVIDTAVTTKLSKLEPGEIFQMGREFFIKGFVLD